MMGQSDSKFAWYLDITPNQMFSLYEYAIQGKDGLPQCMEQDRRLELKEALLYDKDVTEKAPNDHR